MFIPSLSGTIPADCGEVSCSELMGVFFPPISPYEKSPVGFKGEEIGISEEHIDILHPLLDLNDLADLQ